MNSASFIRVGGGVRPWTPVFERVVVKEAAAGEEGARGEGVVMPVGERESGERIGVERINPEMIRSERIVASEEGSEDLEGVDCVELPELVVGRPVGLARPADCTFGIAVPVVAGLLVGVTQDVIGLRDFL